MLWWWCGFLGLVDISAAAGHWKSCHFLSSGVPSMFIQHCLLAPRLSKDILNKNSNLLLSSWGSGSYHLLLRTCIFRGWQACTELKEALPLMMHWCSRAIGGGVLSSPISYPVTSTTNILCLPGKQFLGFQSPSCFHFICCFVLLQLSGDWCELS